MKNRHGFIETVMESPTIVFLIVSILVVFGVFGLRQMNKQEFPEFPVRMGIVAVAYPGATSDEVEQQVTFPLEEFLFTYPEVDKTKTFSITKEGITYVRVYVNISVKDEQKMWTRIRHGLRDFKSKLPAGVAAIVVVDDFGSTSSLMITLESTDKSYREMKGYMDLLKRRLHRVPAMGNIKTLGEQQEELVVTVDKARLASYGIGYELFAATLAGQGMTSLGGIMETDDGLIPLHVESPLRSEAEVAEQVIFTDPTGHAVQLKDVATIERRYADPTN